MQQKEIPSVLYGDEVCLSELDLGGIVCGDADVTESVFLDKEINFVPGEAVHNQQLCQFKLLPKFQYTAAKVFRRRLQRSQVKLDSSNWATKLDPCEQLYKDLARDKKQIDDEQATNEMEAARAAGLHVTFGSVVQLKHVHSGQFLTQTKNRASVDRLAMEVALIPDGSEASWWKVLPGEKVRCMGDPVRDGDKITLQNLKFTDSFLFVSSASAMCTRGEGCSDGEEDAPELERLSTVRMTASQREEIGAVLLHRSCCARFEVNACPRGARFQVTRFRAGVGKLGGSSSSSHSTRHQTLQAEDDRSIRGSACCTLYLREDDSYLTVHPTDGSVRWVPATSNSIASRSALLWRVRRREVDRGGAQLPRNCSDILLQHLATGRYLEVRTEETEASGEPRTSEEAEQGSEGSEEEEENVEAPAPVVFSPQMTADLHSERVLWSVRAFTGRSENEGGPWLADGEVAWLEHQPERGLNGAHQAKTGPAASEPVRLWLAHDEKETEAQEARCWEGVRAVCRTGARPANAAVIEIRAVAEAEARAVDHLARCSQVLSGLSELLAAAPVCSIDQFEAESDDAVDHIDAHPLSQLPRPVLEVAERCLGAMIVACTRGAGADPLKNEGPPEPDSQDRLRGSGVINLTVGIVNQVLKKLPSERARERFPALVRVCRLGFRLLQKSCVGNEANKQALIAHLETFNLHGLLDVGAFEASLEIYRDSEHLLMSIDFERVWTHIAQMREQPRGEQKIMDTFIAICQCNDVSIVKNQNLCIRFMQAFPDLLPQIETSDSDVRIRDNSRGEWVSMAGLLQAPGGERGMLDTAASPASADAECYRFYMKVLDFMVKVVKGRNALAIQHLAVNSERYAVGCDHLLRVISIGKFPASYRARCCRLMAHLYIDCDPHLVVQPLSLTGVWRKLLHRAHSAQEMRAAYSYISGEAGPDSPDDDDDDGGEPRQSALRPNDLKAALLQLSFEHARTDVEDMEVNRFAGAFVQLIHQLVKFGFYHSHDPVANELVPDLNAIRTLMVPLVQLLDGRGDVCDAFGAFSADTARFELTEKTLIVMETKLKVAQVLSDLVESGMSERQREFMHFWDKMLSRKFGIQDWASAVASVRTPAEPTLNGEAKQSQLPNLAHCHHSHRLDEDEQPGRSKLDGTPLLSNRQPVSESSSEVSADQRPSQADCESRQVVEWTTEDVWELASSFRNTHPLMTDLSPARLGHVSRNGCLPEFFKVLLDLTRYKHQALKEVAISFMFSTFSQHSQVVSMLRTTHIVCDPGACALYFEVREEVLRLSKSMRLLPRQHNNTTNTNAKAEGSADPEAVPAAEPEPEPESAKSLRRESERSEAFSVCFEILHKWTRQCSSKSSPHAPSTARRLLVNQGVERVLIAILQIPVQRGSKRARQLEQLEDSRMRDLFKAVYELLAALCARDRRVQNRLLVHLDLYLQHAKVEGLHVETALVALMDGNTKALLEQGRRLVEFFLVAMLAKHDAPSPRWIDLVRALSFNKDTRALVLDILSKQDASTRRLLGVLPSDCKRDRKKSAGVSPDRLVEGLAEPGSTAYAEMMLRSALLELLATACTGKQASSEVYCASLVSWPVALRAVVGTDIKSNGERLRISPTVLYKIRGSHLRFLLNIFMETSVNRLKEEYQKPNSGIWAYGGADRRHWFKGCGTLMETVKEDLRLLASKLSGHSGASDTTTSLLEEPVVEKEFTDSRLELVEGHDELTWALYQYVTATVLPFLLDYYDGPEVLESHPTARATSEQMHDALDTLLQCPIPADWVHVQVHGETVNMRKRCWETLRSMSQEARVRPEWIQHLKNSQFRADSQAEAGPSEAEKAELALQKTTEAMIGELALCLKVSNNLHQGGGPVGLGLRQLALILNQDAEVDMYASLEDDLSEKPRYEDFIMSMLEITHDHATKEDVLLNVLQLMRCSLYVVEPKRKLKARKGPPGVPVDEPDQDWGQQWGAFLRQSAVVKASEPAAETLQWLQEKFDGMGATTAALRLVSHTSHVVQSEAVVLLLALLQGGNCVVQNTVAVYLTRQKEDRFFKALKDVLERSKTALRGFKKSVKQMRSLGADRNSPFGEEQRERSLVMQAETALLMRALRLCQLLSEGQFRPWQRLMHKQPWLPSFDLLEGCLELFDLILPIIPDTLALNDGNITVLALQLLETISESIQGPEPKNQQTVLSSNFLAGCNRVLSSVVYSPVDHDSPARIDGTDTRATVSDLKSWLKSDVLKCTLALFEACNNPRIPELVLEFFELPKLVSQMVQAGRILGLADPAEHPNTHGRYDFAEGFGPVLRASSISLMWMKGEGLGGETLGSSSSYSPASWLASSFVMGGKATTRQEMVDALRFSAGFEETVRGELFSLFFVLRHLDEFDSSGRVQLEITALQRHHPVLFEFLAERTFEVELVRQQLVRGALQPQAEKVFFAVSSDALEVTNSSHFQQHAREVLFAVPRKNPVEKARALLGQLKTEMHRLRWIVAVARSSPWRRFAIRYRELFEAAPLVLSLLIMLLLLLVYAIPLDPNTDEVVGGGTFYGFNLEAPGYDSEEVYPWASGTADPGGLGATFGGVVSTVDPASKFLLQLKNRWFSTREWDYWPAGRWLALTMAALHLIMTIINIATHLFQEFPLIAWDAWEQYVKEIDSQTWSSSTEKRESRGKLQPVRHGKTFLDTFRDPPEVCPRPLKMRLVVLVLRKSFLLVYFALLAIVSLMGFVMSPFFHVLYLLDFFRGQSGRLVTRSLVLGAPNLLRTFWLGTVVLVCFGFMSYNYFSDTINANQQMCRTPFQCVVKHLLDSMTGDLTTVLGNDLGVFAFPPMVFWADSWRQFRSFYVFISLIFWVFLLQGIIQGQIIDAFAELRNQAYAMEEDLEQKCFVSSVDRYVFNSYPGEWEKRRGGKYVFNYLLFLVHLVQKDPMDMNGLENYVLRKFNEDSIEFLPIGTFVARERETARMEEGDNNQHKDLIQSVAEDVRRVEEKLESELASIKTMMETMLQRLPPAPAPAPSVNEQRPSDSGPSGGGQSAPAVPPAAPADSVSPAGVQLQNEYWT